MLQPAVTPSTISLYSKPGEGSITTWLTFSRAWTSFNWSITQQQINFFFPRYRFVFRFPQNKLKVVLDMDKLW